MLENGAYMLNSVASGALRKKLLNRSYLLFTQDQSGTRSLHRISYVYNILKGEDQLYHNILNNVQCTSDDVGKRLGHSERTLPEQICPMLEDVKKLNVPNVWDLLWPSGKLSNIAQIFYRSSENPLSSAGAMRFT